MNTITAGVNSQTATQQAVYSEQTAKDQAHQKPLNNQEVSQKEQVKQEEPLSASQLEKVAQQLQDFVGQMNKSLQFNVHEESGRDVIQVVDRKSGDLIKQYPSEEVLDLVAKLSQATGSLIDEQI